MIGAVTPFSIMQELMKNWNLSVLIERERNKIQEAIYGSDNQLRMLFSGSSVISFILISTEFAGVFDLGSS